MWVCDACARTAVPEFLFPLGAVGGGQQEGGGNALVMKGRKIPNPALWWVRTGSFPSLQRGDRQQAADTAQHMLG